MSVPPVRSVPVKGVPTPLGRGFFPALGLTQRTRRETQRARVSLRSLRQSLCDLCVEMPDAITRPRTRQTPTAQGGRPPAAGRRGQRRSLAGAESVI